MSDTVIPVPTPGGGRGRRREERRKWRLIQWSFTTLSKAGSLLVLAFICLYFWRVPVPFINYYWQDEYGLVVGLGVIVAFVFARLPEAVSQAPGDEVAVIKKVLFALIPSYALPIVFYRLWIIQRDFAPDTELGLAVLCAGAIIALVITQIYLGLRYSERTTEIGPTPPS